LALYVVYVPLAVMVEVAFGGQSSEPWMFWGATVSLVIQAGAVAVVRRMPLWGWTVLTVSVPVSFVLYGLASHAAGEALGVALVIPVMWVAVFLPGRLLALAIGVNCLGLASLLVNGASRGEWALLAVRILTIAIVGTAIHSVVSALRGEADTANLRADRDHTTGVLSRAPMLDLLTRALAKDSAASRSGVAIILVDSYGHLAGDQALQQLADRLQDTLRDQDFIARWGGEEFLICATDIPSQQALQDACERLRQSIAREPFYLDGHNRALTVSLGATLTYEPYPTSALIATADAALYAAKHTGRNNACIRLPETHHLEVPARAAQLTHIRQAVHAAATQAGFSADRSTDMQLAASEASATLLRHADTTTTLAIATHTHGDSITITINRHPRPRLRPDRPLRQAQPTETPEMAIIQELADHVTLNTADKPDQVHMLFTRA
jgi:diguanylate cyclase (GGDEF)-like protein